MSAFVPGAVLRPMAGPRFVLDVNPIRLKSVSLLTLKANSIRAVLQPPHNIVGVTLPTDRGFTVTEHGTTRAYLPGSAHLLNLGEQFDMRAREGCTLLGGSFFIDTLQPYTDHLLQSGTVRFRDLAPGRSLHTPYGMALQRQMARTWVACQAAYENAADHSMALAEYEDELLACFVLATCSDGYPRAPQGRRVPIYLHRAEAFLLANLKTAVTRDRLAQESGVCIRTLSRAFNKFYGIGPLAFLKQRRMDAAFRDLLAANPEIDTVSQIALAYGFIHLGKFAIDYRQLFGELPSSTLMH